MGCHAKTGQRVEVAVVLTLLIATPYGCTVLNRDMQRQCPVDPIFGLPTPLLFAHRGGAREAPESTERGFEYAREQAGVDVLELDVRLTKDGQFVVWHGPSLDNVRIRDQPDCPCLRKQRNVADYDWAELRERAWVADPPCQIGECNLAAVDDKDSKRQLILLKDFLDRFRCAPLNVELKDFWVSPCHVADFVRLLDNAPRCTGNGPPHQRPIIVAAANDLVLADFRRQSGGRYPTNIPVVESLSVLPYVPRLWYKSGRALEVPRSWWFSGPGTVGTMHRAGAAVHVFITTFLGIGGLDEQPLQVSQEEIDALLERDIDGIMTDRPCEVRVLMNNWTRQHRPADCAPPQIELPCQQTQPERLVRERGSTACPCLKP